MIQLKEHVQYMDIGHALATKYVISIINGTEVNSKA